jgi:putative hemolysin/predicted secreted protein
MVLSRRSGILPGLFIFGVLLVLLVVAAGCTQQTVTPPVTTKVPGMANPASVYCGQTGGTTVIRQDASGGQYGMCSFNNGTSCEEWALFRGEGCRAGVAAATTTAPSAGIANPASVACIDAGGSLEIKEDTTGGQYGMCTFANGTSCEEWALFRGEGCKPGLKAVPTTAAEGKKMVTFTEADKGKTGDIAQGTRFAVQLKENPTTGFEWNATVSSGLVIQDSTFQQDKTPREMVGVGGTRTWVITAKDLGTQKFSASYRRSWEPVTGNETAYSVNIKVVKI